MNGPRERIDKARETATILRKASERVERKGWTAGPLARNRQGRPVPSHDTRAEEWSARGAICKEIAGRRLKPSTEDVVLRMCLSALAAEILRAEQALDDHEWDDRDVIDHWNDRAGQTARNVAEVMASAKRNIKGGR